MSGGSAGAIGFPLAGRFKGTLLAQSPAGVLRHANAHRGSPEEINSEQGPERNGAIPRQRTRLEEGHRSEWNKADTSEDRPTTYPTREHGTRIFIRQTDQTGRDGLHGSNGVRDVKQEKTQVVERTDQVRIDIRAKRRGRPDRGAEHHHPGGKGTADKAE